MFFLSKLPALVSHRKKRVGRGIGSGKGAKSGRGITRHQKARESIPIHFEGGQGRFIKKFPLLRGKGRNKPLKTSAKVINLSDLNVFSDGEVVNRESLVHKGIIKKEEKVIKILSNGKLEKKLIIAVPISQPARREIERLGGKIQQ